MTMKKKLNFTPPVLKKINKALPIAVLVITAASCDNGYDDSALWEQVNQNTEELAAQAARIAALETWQAETNTNIQALQTLLSTTDYITAVTPVVQDGVEVGYTISFLNTPAITIYHGTKGDKGDTGDTPQIGVAQTDDGNWYWTLNGELLTGTDGQPIQANGTKGDTGEQEQGEQGEQGPVGSNAPQPQLATGTKLTEQNVTTDTQNNPIEPDAIYLSVDGGQTWTRVSGEKGDTGDTGATGATGAQGDSFFKNVDYTSNLDCVTFYLSEGGFFSVPRYVEISLTFNPTSASLLYGQTTKIQCIVSGSSTADDLYLIAVPDGWTVSINDDLTLTVTAPTTDSTGEILVMLDNKKGSTTIGRIRVKTAGGIVGTVLKADGLASDQVADLIGSRTDLTEVILTNCDLSSQDWNAISKNKSLETIDLGKSTYNSNSFYYMHSVVGNSTLQFLTVPDGVTTISERAFYDCDKLTTVTIPASVKEIWWESFSYCEELTTFTIPADSKLTKIGKSAFVRCYKLESIFIPATVKTIDNMAFNMCQSLKSVTFAEGSQLTEIPYFCFADNEALTSIEIPSLVTTLGDYVFWSSANLADVTLPDGLKTIGIEAFCGCKAMTTIDLPAAVESIGQSAFSGCSSLATVTCLAETPPTLGENAFRNCADGLQILVPSASVEKYKQASGWSAYADKIVAIEP